MPRLTRCALLAAALAAATTAPAQPAPPPAENPDIVITGQKDVERQIRDFVGTLTRTMDAQITRFAAGVCPAAVGFPATIRDALVARMRRVAETAGIRVGKPGCMPNVLVMVTHDKRAFVETLNKKYPNYFNSMSIFEVHSLAHSPGPAAAWQLRGPTLNAAGVELERDGIDDYTINRTFEMPSRITSSVRPQFQGAAIVIEAKALEGLTTTQLADYAAMRTFARTDPARLPATAPPTILKVLDAAPDAQVPLSLTQWDLSFLRALYASSADLYAHGQRSEINARIAKDLKRPPEERGK